MSYQGITSAAQLSESNQSEFASAATDVAAQVITTDDSEGAIGSLPIGVEMEDESYNCGGSVSNSGSEHKLVLEYADYCLNLGEGSMIFDGTVVVETNNSGGQETQKITYKNFSLTTNSETSVLNGVVTITWSADQSYATASSWNYTLTVNGERLRWTGSTSCISDGDCTISNHYVGEDGSVYQMTSVDMTQDGSFYELKAEFYHPEFGYVQLHARDIMLCDDDTIGSGTITLRDDNDMILTITFNGCGAESTLNLAGVAVTEAL